MGIYLVNDQPVFRNVLTKTPDGTSGENYSFVVLGPTVRGAIIGSQLRWQEYFSHQCKIFPISPHLDTSVELPSLPLLVSISIQIRKALYGSNPKLRNAAESLRDELRANYRDNNLPTSTNVSYVNHAITHRNRTSRAYELPFYLPQQIAPQDFPGFYKVKTLMGVNGLERELISLFGQNDVRTVYEALKEIMGEEPSLVVYYSGTLDMQESIVSASAGITTGEVRVGNLFAVRNPLWDARGVLVRELPPNKGTRRQSKTPQLEKILAS